MREGVGPDVDLTTAVSAAQGGDEAAFRVVYRAVQPQLLGYVRSLVGPADAEDVASEAWLQIARDLPGFRGDGGSIRGWAARIARNRALDHIRARSRRPVSGAGVDELVQLPDRADTAGEALDAVATDRALAAIAALPREQAEAVMLRVVMGLDSTSAARVLGKRPGSVRMATHRGLRRLAELLADVEPAPVGDQAAAHGPGGTARPGASAGAGASGGPGPGAEAGTGAGAGAGGRTRAHAQARAAAAADLRGRAGVAAPSGAVARGAARAPEGPETRDRQESRDEPRTCAEDAGEAEGRPEAGPGIEPAGPAGASAAGAGPRTGGGGARGGERVGGQRGRDRPAPGGPRRDDRKGDAGGAPEGGGRGEGADGRRADVTFSTSKAL